MKITKIISKFRIFKIPIIERLVTVTEEVDPKTQEVIEVQEDDTEHVHEPIKPVEEKKPTEKPE